ncbi:MAG: hypothetical protein PHU23_18375 [Dehalococcoidales bacterium]|nr:hypothetical protein [Dehalococcoidales bacterium]
MGTEESWIKYLDCPEMEGYSQEYAGKINKIWEEKKPRSEEILVDVWGEQNVAGARGHWAVGQQLKKWGILYEESPIFENRGDSFDYNIIGFGWVDVKTARIHHISIPDRVHVKHAQISKPIKAYIFCCWHTEKRTLWILGWEYRLDYLKEAKLYKVGDSIQRGEVKKPMYVLGVNDIKSVQSFQRITEGNASAEYQCYNCYHIFCAMHEELSITGKPIPNPCPNYEKHR